MSKVQGDNQELAADFTTYVDDSRVATWSAKEVWREAQRVGLIWQYLGLQDEPHKRRIIGQDRVPWIGTKVHIIYGYIYHIIGEGRWEKTRITIKNVCKGSHWDKPCITRSCKVIGDY